jgi:hypothetical protein
MPADRVIPECLAGGSRFLYYRAGSRMVFQLGDAILNLLKSEGTGGDDPRPMPPMDCPPVFMALHPKTCSSLLEIMSHE